MPQKQCSDSCKLLPRLRWRCTGETVASCPLVTLTWTGRRRCTLTSSSTSLTTPSRWLSALAPAPRTCRCSVATHRSVIGSLHSCTTLVFTITQLSFCFSASITMLYLSCNWHILFFSSPWLPMICFLKCLLTDSLCVMFLSSESICQPKPAQDGHQRGGGGDHVPQRVFPCRQL